MSEVSVVVDMDRSRATAARLLTSSSTSTSGTASSDANVDDDDVVLVRESRGVGAALTRLLECVLPTTIPSSALKLWHQYQQHQQQLKIMKTPLVVAPVAPAPPPPPPSNAYNGFKDISSNRSHLTLALKGLYLDRPHFCQSTCRRFLTGAELQSHKDMVFNRNRNLHSERKSHPARQYYCKKHEW